MLSARQISAARRDVTSAEAVVGIAAVIIVRLLFYKVEELVANKIHGQADKVVPDTDTPKVVPDTDAPAPAEGASASTHSVAAKKFIQLVVRDGKGWARAFAAFCVASQVLYGVVVIGKYGKEM